MVSVTGLEPVTLQCEAASGRFPALTVQEANDIVRHPAQFDGPDQSYRGKKANPE
jgi:hypothetical protein